MAHRHRAQERAKGGRTSMAGRMNYTAKSNVSGEAGKEKDEFAHGGGHKAHGHKSKHRADKRARGGGVTHSPFSSAARGNDEKRRPVDKDNHQPRAAGGAAFARGGRAKRHAGIGSKGHSGHRPSAGHKHEYNYGHHDGSGHEEGLARTHPPVHHKHGGTPHAATGGTIGAFAHGGHAHHAGHGAHHAHHPHHDGHHAGHHGIHGSHKAKGKKHRAEGGKVDKEDD